MLSLCLITDILSHSCTCCLIQLPNGISIIARALDKKLKVESQVTFAPSSIYFKLPTIFPFCAEEKGPNFVRNSGFLIMSEILYERKSLF